MLRKLKIAGILFLTFIISWYVIIFVLVVSKEDDYLDNEKASNVIVSYDGSNKTLEYYIMTANYKKVKDLLKKEGDRNLNKINNSLDMSPLMIAATLPYASDVIKMSELLINEGVNINLLNSHGANVLYYVIKPSYAHSHKDNIKILKFYLKKGAKKKILLKNVDMDGNLVNKSEGKSMTLKEYCESLGFDLKEEAKLLNY